MNRHLMIKTSCFSVIAPALPYYRPYMDICVLELRNSPAITRIPRLESEHFNHNLFDPDLIRGSLNHHSPYRLPFENIISDTGAKQEICANPNYYLD